MEISSVVAAPTSPASCHHNKDPKNIATTQEVQWALRIKTAAIADPDVNADKICDLEFLQHALIAKHAVPTALQRIKRMQSFKKHHGIQLDGSMEQATRDIQAFFAAHPGLYLSLGTLPDGSNVMCSDYGQFFARRLDTPEAYAIRLRGLFYFMQATQPNILAMRQGVASLSDMKRVSWRNFNLHFLRQFAQILSHAYPMRIRQIVVLHTHMAVWLGYTICKVFFSPKARQRMVFCRDDFHQATGGRYTPDVLPASWEGGTFDSSREHLQEVWLQRLQERYALAETFSLLA